MEPTSSSGHADGILDGLLSLGPPVRYAAVRVGDRVVSRQRRELRGASSSESDWYEEWLVNPALLTLAGQRGAIDCGGLRYLLVGYGNFTQLVVPTRTGHVSVALELESEGEAAAWAARVRAWLASRGAD